jgi:hypothetical protein
LAPARITAARLGGGRLTGPNPIIKSGQEPLFEIERTLGETDARSSIPTQNV